MSGSARVLRRTLAGLLGAGILLAAMVGLTAPPAYAEGEVYAALGDSYASGLGTRDYDHADCKRGPQAYPALITARAGASLNFQACSGARVPDVQGAQLDAVAEDTTHVTVQVGGNDVGFVDVITRCAQPWPTTCWGAIDAANAYATDTLPGTLDGLYDAVAAKVPDATVVVVGYPRLFNGEECNAGSRISPGEQEELNKTADLLSDTIQGRAEAHGFGYVDARPVFDGHAVCDDAEYVNGLANPVSESYHPNRAGHVAYADAVQPALLG